jgi:hypothetical protein
MSTIYSNEQFGIEVQKEDLKFRRTFGNLQDISMPFDDQLLLQAIGKSGETNCQFGGSFKENHVGMISQVKYFLPEIEDKTIYVDKLKFQASSDNSTWVDLFTPDENIHEGWNYYKWETSD